MTDQAGEGVSHSHPQGKLPILALGALGVVFGDIGTSPLYALKESFVGHHPLAVDPAHIYGVLSLVFWTMTLIVTVKYVFIIMRADNHGEGGSMALLALISRKLGKSRWTPTIAILGVLAAALFYGDAIITPAVSVLSAVEGLETVNDGFAPFILPIAIVILIGLFLIQKHGTARVGALFGPVMVVYFLVLAALGILNIVRHPGIIGIINPMWAVHFFALDAKLAFLALGSVVLAVTGAEALYADMGHFGRKAISIAWLYAAFPCLLLNYMGQGALLLDLPEAAENPFFLLAPEWARLPLVILATLATVIASQAVISGAFSVTQQAVQLGFLPRLKISHTSASAAGQIYVPMVNWALLFLVVLLVLGFQSSSNLAAAYGIAVTGTMVITTCMMAVLTFSVWRWNRLLAGAVTGLFLAVDGAYFLSNATKIPDGGWFPLLVAAVVFIILTTWSTGRKIMNFYLMEGAMDVELFIQSVSGSLKRVPGTAIFLNSRVEGVPPALLHNVKHNKVLHERVIILTVRTEGVPHLPLIGRSEVNDLGAGFYRVVLRHGFMEEVDIPAAMKAVDGCGGPINVSQTSYFLSRQTLIPSEKPGMAIWREKLFAWMMRNAVTPMDFFKLPTNRVVELGSQVEI
ncbi:MULTISPECIES: potassium transporter Kup [unclassified Sphingobium]|uniref:potassium transporter Kup n=1 Tax=unclassified Sphingobium TaxID=2611147 RepID=UPI00082B64FD|nr:MULTISPECIES: potassium transporter Kup [unclassified Sphingobium]